MRKTQRHSRDEMFAHIESWRGSGQSQKIYCEQAGLAYTTFQYWAKKFRQEAVQDKAMVNAPGFIPVKVQPDLVRGQMPHQLHFLFPNGIQVKCSERVHPEVLQRLLNL
jgi:hypothetical protein